MKSIALITCWYGPFPWYFPYFVFSCKFNPTVDFIIVTDNDDEIYNRPDNLKIINIKFKDLKNNFSEKLGFTVNLDYPYKLCDFKPAYGFLFPEIVKKYDFWGISDIDIIYGDICAFITDEILDDYDVISSRHDYITGSFCLFRNKDIINRLFFESRDYKTVFNSSEHFCFDECNFQFKSLNEGASILDLENNIESMTYIVKKAEKEHRLKAFFDFMIIEGTQGRLTFDKGKIIYKNQYEVMFYHLIKFKEDCKKRTVLTPIPDRFKITPTRIIQTK